MSNITNETAKKETETSRYLAAQQRWIAENQLIDDAMAGVGEFEEFVIKYDFVKFVDEEVRGKLFYSFGPNWAFHLMNTIDEQQIIIDGIDEEIVIHGHVEISVADPDLLIANHITEKLDELCKGEGITNEDTLLALYFWRIDVRTRHWMKDHPDKSFDEAFKFLTEDVVTRRKTKPLQNKLADWLEEAKRLKKLYNTSSCPSCNGPPIRPVLMRQLAYQPNLTLVWRELLPIRTSCCGKETINSYMTYP